MTAERGKPTKRTKPFSLVETAVAAEVDRGEAEAEVDEVAGEAEAESLVLAWVNAGTVERKGILSTIALILRKITHQR